MSAIPLEDRIAIQDLLTEFGWRVDHGEAGRVAELFTETGTLETPMFKLTGKAEIARQFGERAKDKSRVSRHIWTNLRLTGLEDGRVQGVAIVQTYMGNGETPLTGGDFVIGDSLDIFVKGGDGVWRFAERRLVIDFKGRVAS